MKTMSRRRNARKTLSKPMGYGREFPTVTEQDELFDAKIEHYLADVMGALFDYNRIYNELRTVIAAMSSHNHGITLKTEFERMFDSDAYCWDTLIQKVKGCAFYHEKTRTATRLLKLMLYIEHRSSREGILVRAMPLDQC